MRRKREEEKRSAGRRVAVGSEAWERAVAQYAPERL